MNAVPQRRLDQSPRKRLGCQLFLIRNNWCELIPNFKKKIIKICWDATYFMKKLRKSWILSRNLSLRPYLHGPVEEERLKLCFPCLSCDFKQSCYVKVLFYLLSRLFLICNNFTIMCLHNKCRLKLHLTLFWNNFLFRSLHKSVLLHIFFPCFYIIFFIMCVIDYFFVF